MNSEVQLLAEALQTNGESESGGVKYIYMDDNTVYRFENNRMKKVSAAMIKKANKLLETQGVLPNDAKTTPAKRGRKPAAKKTRQVPEPTSALNNEDDVDDAEESEPEPEPEPEPKPKRRTATKTTTRQTKPKSNAGTGSIDIDEYYNNKNKMEFMSMELERLNNKVNKLKQYKSIVNKITGGEYECQGLNNDAEYYPEQYSQQVPQTTSQPVGRNGRKINDTLFNF